MRVIRKDEVTEPFRAPLGELIYEMIGKPSVLGGTTNHSFVHVTIPPQKASPAHYHKLAEETYYVLEGEGEIVVDGARRVMIPGDACLIMPREVHKISNRRDVNLEFLTISAPAWVPDDTYPVEEADAVDAS